MRYIPSLAVRPTPMMALRGVSLARSAPTMNLIADPTLASTASHLCDSICGASTLISDSALASTADDLAGSLFGASLFPWLAMLYWLKQPLVGAPSGVSFGLTFLLAFVFGSIPAAIGAGVLYGVSLADADWLHGAAESLLAITNCVVVLGFRAALDPSSTTDDEAQVTSTLQTAATALGVLSALSAVAVLASGAAAVHTPWLGGVGNLPAGLWPDEPSNALSVPTWIIHTSSLVEWLVAMGLAWRYAEVSRQPRWRGVTWGMLPLHTSGIVACTYHLFYNAPAVSWCVALQAGMTCLGNTTLAYACLRLALASGWTWEMGKQDALELLDQVTQFLPKPASESGATAARDAVMPVDSPRAATSKDGTTAQPAATVAAPQRRVTAESALVGWEDLGDAWSRDGNAAFLLKLLALSGGLAYLVKYAPALLLSLKGLEVPDEVISAAALAVIVVPTGLNCWKWQQRSAEGAEFVGDF